MTLLFEVKTTLGGEHHAIGYNTIEQALDDAGLCALMCAGAVVSIWRGDLRLTRDITSWRAFCAQLAGAASVILRHYKGVVG